MNTAELPSLKVLEYGEFICGPYYSKLFADLGAEVDKDILTYFGVRTSNGVIENRHGKS